MKDTLTWERVALGAVTILLALLAFIGKGVINEVNSMSTTMEKLNDTLIEFRVQIALNKAQNETTFSDLSKQITTTREWVGKLSNRIYQLEKKRE